MVQPHADERQRLLPREDSESNSHPVYNSTVINLGQTLHASAKPPRVVTLDLLRGLIMMLQSIDHSKIFLTTWYGSHETWYELKPFPSTALFLLRLATHPCAPGFAFLMGIGIVYFIRSRKGLGWTDGRLVWHFFLRGTLLVVVNHLMTRNMQLQSGFRIGFATSVLFALGINFFLGALASLLANSLYIRTIRMLIAHDKTDVPNIAEAEARAARIRIFGLLVLAVAFCVSNVVLMPEPVENGVVEGYGWWRYLLYLPGLSSFFYSMYPPMNWFGLTLYGIAFGYIMIKDKRDNRASAKFHMHLSLLFFFFFLFIRLPGGFGNINPSLLPPAPPGTPFNNPYLASTQTFFNTIKYAPDLAYSSLFVAVNHLLLAALYVIPTESTNYFYKFVTEGPLLDYGRSAFFFYILHFYLYYLIAKVIAWAFPGVVNGGMVDLGFAWYFVVWIGGLIVLWGLCRWYAKFKARRGPDSVFRFF